jgi:hypothetical protein
VSETSKPTRYEWVGDRREHGGEKFGDSAKVPYVSDLRHSDTGSGYHWAVTDHVGLETRGYSLSRSRAVRAARKALREDYLAFAATVARVEGLEFDA